MSYTFGMGRFTGIALVLALAAGCAKSSKESRMESTGPGATGANGGEGGGGAQTLDSTKPTDSSKQGALPVTPPTGSQPLDPSANADPNSPKQQARANGLLGNTDQFDDSPIDGNNPDTAKHAGSGDAKVGTKVGGTKGQQPTADRPTGGQIAQQVAFQLDTPDAAVKTALEAHKADLTGCRKSGTGVLEIAITLDESGKVTGAKISAKSTLKDKATRDCVLAVVKKLELGKGVTITGPLKLTFN